MKFELNWSIQCRAISTGEQIHSLLGWLWFGTVSAVLGVSIFENEIGARLAAGINIWKCWMYKNSVSEQWHSLLPTEADFLCKQQEASAKANTGHSNSLLAGCRFSCLCICNRLCTTERTARSVGVCWIAGPQRSKIYSNYLSKEKCTDNIPDTDLKVVSQCTFGNPELSEMFSCGGHCFLFVPRCPNNDTAENRTIIFGIAKSSKERFFH